MTTYRNAKSAVGDFPPCPILSVAWRKFFKVASLAPPFYAVLMLVSVGWLGVALRGRGYRAQGHSEGKGGEGCLMNWWDRGEKGKFRGMVFANCIPYVCYKYSNIEKAFFNAKRLKNNKVILSLLKLAIFCPSLSFAIIFWLFSPVHSCVMPCLLAAVMSTKIDFPNK